jgi:hypothetical protein
MNERIRKFAEQSGFFPVPDETETDWEYRAENARYENFAELIVRECVQTITDNTPAPNPESDTPWELGYNRAMKDCIHHIKEHFGVKE